MNEITPALILEKRESIMKQQYFDEEESKPIGNYILLVNHYHKGQPLLTLGPSFMFFLAAFLIFNGFTWLLLHHMQQYQQLKPFYMIKIVSLIFVDVVWLTTALINPGIASKASEQEGKTCSQCLALQRKHCDICKICIDQHLFHSRLIGGCIGKYNYSVFKILLLALLIEVLCLITIIPIMNQMS